MPRKLEVVITGDTAGLERALNKSSAAATTFGGKMTKVGSSLESFGKTLTKSVTLPIVGIGAVMVKVALDSEKSTARMDAAFKNVGVSVKGASGAVDSMESSGRKLGFTNNQIRDSIGSLVTSTGSLSKAHRELGIAEDLARFKGVDLTTSTRALTMANAGSMRAIKQLGITIIPVTNAVDALKNSHIKLNTEQGRAALAAAKLIDKQATIASMLDIVSGKVKGQGKAYAGTAAGGMAVFRAQLDGLAEKMGTTLLPILNRLVGYLQRLLSWFQQLSPTTQKWIMITAGAAALLGPTISAIGALTKAFVLLSAAMDTNPIVLLISAIVILGGAMAAATFAPKQFEAVLEKLGVSAGTAKTVVESLQIAFQVFSSVVNAALFSFRTTFETIFLSVGPAISLVADLIHGRWAKAWQDLKDLALAPLRALWASFTAIFPQFPALVSQAWSAIKSATSSAWNAISSVVSSHQRLILAVVTVGMSEIARVLVSQWGNVKSVLVGVWNGIKAALQASWRAMERAALVAVLAIIEPFTHIPTGWANPISSAIKKLQQFKRDTESTLASIDAKGKITTVFTKAQSAVTTTGGAVARAARSVGASIGASLAAGISSQVQSVASAAAQIAAAAEVAIRAKAQVHSLSPLYHGIGFDMFSSVGVGIMDAMGSVSQKIATAINNVMLAAITAAKTQIAKAKTDLNTAMATLGGNVISAAGSLGPAFGTAKTRKLGGKLTAEQAAQAKQQAAEQQAALDKATLDARTKLSTDIAAGADAGTLAADQAAIDQAVQANADYQTQKQIDADAKALTEQQARDKNNLEKQWTALQNELKAHPERAAKIKKEIDKLLAKYGITPASVTAATDWSTAQTLFVQSMGDLNTSMQDLTKATQDLAGARAAAASPGGGGMPHAKTGGYLGDGSGAIPIVAHAGEYVVRAKAVEKLGLPFMQMLNHYDEGGILKLPKLGKNPKLNSSTGLPDVPEYRAAAMYLNDYGYDRNDTPIGTALAGLLGPRAQAQAALRATYIDSPQGKVQLRHGLWRGTGGVVDSKMLAYWQGMYPGVTFEPGTPGQQISWMQAASRLPQGGQELGSLIAASLGGTGTGLNTHGSLVEQLTSHAVHFAKGGLIPALATGGRLMSDGLYYGHKGETVTPANTGGGTVRNEIVVMLDKRVVGRAVQDYLGEQTRWGNPGLPR